jgi:hypothetical protein
MFAGWIITIDLRNLAAGLHINSLV